MKKIILSFMLIFMLPTAFANLSCYEKSSNSEQGASIGGFDKEAATSAMQKELQNPAQDLVMCVAQIPFEGAKGVLDACGCYQAVKELCSFDISEHDISASGGASKSMCAPFAPWSL